MLTSSRKKYINTDAGGDQLVSLDNEKKELVGDSGLAKKMAKVSIPRSVLLR